MSIPASEKEDTEPGQEHHLCDLVQVSIRTDEKNEPDIDHILAVFDGISYQIIVDSDQCTVIFTLQYLPPVSWM